MAEEIDSLLGILSGALLSSLKANDHPLDFMIPLNDDATAKRMQKELEEEIQVLIKLWETYGKRYNLHIVCPPKNNRSKGVQITYEIEVLTDAGPSHITELPMRASTLDPSSLQRFYACRDRIIEETVNAYPPVLYKLQEIARGETPPPPDKVILPVS
ncbi:MAG: hypothetical protein A3B31_00430 [Candidatus Komeilibacteria bacterium RIFCSPLOWO2_01_FULL_53_11]|uniref:Uncharacterized protein n=1 Tax=Candidatus Komeilibacteria bacterium RIFCSPLOWO2_01_FULL_53_11 TaxID=1798552 RepID=A0A1G2BU50_9BACT|nr:MAG: hypothetical protein A3B31_00430 [Candidatus Komeilibacteria bacterium RIFCSPLOWO2_01_FULL_53_11]